MIHSSTNTTKTAWYYITLHDTTTLHGTVGTSGTLSPPAHFAAEPCFYKRGGVKHVILLVGGWTQNNTRSQSIVMVVAVIIRGRAIGRMLLLIDH